MPEKPDKPERKPDERAWKSLTFTGYQPDLSLSTLTPRWNGVLTAIRSDNLRVAIPLTATASATPEYAGKDLVRALELLETYRACTCTPASSCDLHATGV